MRKFVWPVLIFILSIVVWGSTIKITPFIADKILKNECTDKTLTACKDVLSALGATGDIFGATTSLFSGLALFSVAYTLWADANARRESTKPLIINYLDNNSVRIRNPEIQNGREFELVVSTKVSNKNGEAALNVLVQCKVCAEGKELAKFKSFLRQPLVSEGTEELETITKIAGDNCSDFLIQLTEDNRPISFQFEIVYSSLENVKWETRVSYNVSCKSMDGKKRLNSFRSGTDDFDESWGNGAEVPLVVEVNEGSWFHTRK